MDHPKDIDITNFDYALPEDRIAYKPLPERDGSKLLIYKNGDISVDLYRNIAVHLPEKSLLVFNDTQVINARINFTKETGSKIEVFCLEPLDAKEGFQKVFSSKSPSVWKCFIGGAAKWKGGELQTDICTESMNITLRATLIEKREGFFIVSFAWDPSFLSLSEVFSKIGSVPLPPYIKRAAEKSDQTDYQTMFAEKEGSVAAPTASLHFTQNVLKRISEKGIATEKITLHVGAGTFKPVNSVRLEQHDMHAEWLDVSIETIKSLAAINYIIPIGTTSLRTVESLYWIGVKISRGDFNLHLSQWEVYEPRNLNCKLTKEQSFQHLAEWMESKKMERLFTQTSILIAPGYTMRVAKALITNFHQPKSTLLLLVASATGDDWKKIYSYALENDFRFLSYGDGNLLFFS